MANKSAYKFSNVSSARGAPMGRRDCTNEALTVKKVHLQRVPMVDSDYDPGGAYWGGGRDSLPLYVAFGEGATEQQVMFIRAKDRSHAKNKVANVFKNATFYR